MSSPAEQEESRTPTPDVLVVREVYDGNGAHEQFALELERCLEVGPNTIVIEPAALGDETARWIAVGNCLHKTAVLAGFGSLFGAWAAPDRLLAWAPLGTLSLACTAIYTASWQFDPCCQYQVELDSGRLSRLMLESVVSSTPVVLVRREDGRRKVLHSSVSLLAGALCLYSNRGKPRPAKKRYRSLKSYGNILPASAMWKLEPRSAAGGHQYVYAGSELLVSRTPGAWLVISGDASVSRRHACLQLEHSVADAKRGKASTLVLTDQNAKNGTYVRQSSANRQRDGNAAALNESHRIEPSSRVQLQHGDVVRFGLSASYRVVCSPLVVATSMLPNNEAVLQHLHLLGAAFSRDWTPRCTHLVMDTIKLSAKVACALASGGLIVTPGFLPALLQTVKEKKPLLPPAPDFLPAITEPSIQPSPSLFAPNCRRKMLFEGKNFCFGTEKGHRRLAAIIRLAGGECAVVEARHEDLLCSGAALLLRTAEDTSSPTPTFFAALKALRKAGLHVIPESDIVLAVLYCSTERFCNPSVSQQLVLDRPAHHTQTQSSAAVLAAETQDVASAASASQRPNSGTASRGHANVIPETPSSSCSSKKSALAGDALPTPINKLVDNDKAPSGTQLSNGDRNSKLPDVEGPTSSLNVPSVSVLESTSAKANNGDKTSKKRYRSGENIVDNSAAKRSALSKPALLDTQDIEMSQDDGDVKGECSLNMSTFAPPLASTQIYEYENELQSNGFAKPAAGDKPRVQVPSVASAQKTNTKMPKALSAAQKSAVKTGITCVPPTPTPPSQASLAELPAGRDARSPIPSNSVSPQSIVPPGQPESKSLAEISPSLEALQSFPTETLGRTTQFCPELQTAPLPSLEPPCLDGILNSKSSAPDAGPLANPTSRDPFTLLNPNLSEKKGPSKTTDGFQLPAAGVRRRKVQAQQPPELVTSSAVDAVVGGIKRSRSTVELEEEKKRQRLASCDEDAPAPAVSVKQERCTPSPVVPAQSDLAADIPASYDGFVSGKRRQHTSSNKTTDVSDEKVESQVPDPELLNGDVAQDKTEVKPRVAELEKNITVCRTLMVSLVLRTSIIGDDYQPPQESSSADGTMNFKRFRKVRHGGAVASLPRIIGGRDLVPHTTIESDVPDRSIAGTSANPRSLWLSQHPEVTRQIEQEDREQEEDDAAEHQVDSIPNGTRNSHNACRNGPASKFGSVASYFGGAGTSRSTNVGVTQSGSVHSRAAFGREDFSQYQMPSATVRKRIPRTRT